MRLITTSLFAVVTLALFLAASPILLAQADAQGAKSTGGSISSEEGASADSAPQARTINANELLPLLLVEAEKGNAQTMLTIGNLYESGVYGAPRNYGKALEWYTKAAQAGLPEGFYNVGISYEIGQGTAPDPTKAFESFLKSADMGFPLAKQKLGELYLNGTGVLASPEKAISYLTQAGDEGRPEAHFLLARTYLTGAGGVPQDTKKGLDILNKLVDKDYPVAMNEMGAITFLGQYGQTKDYDKAKELFTKGAELANGDAMKNLGALLLDTSDNRVPNRTDALKWLTLSTLFGYNNNQMQAFIQNLRSEMKPEEIQAAENAVRKWYDDRQAEEKARQEEALKQQQQQQQQPAEQPKAGPASAPAPAKK
ncbi:MAG: sel1 repeat family protein [Deltaproteobacteria bacterium]|jgi:TPR repeat protein|nr:sel1 repeat family protein [Deltaproteobacteria bacterium]